MNFNSVADAVTRMAELGSKIAEGVHWLVERRIAVHDTVWRSVLEATMGLRHLSHLHLEMVQATAYPVENDGDIATTTDLYTKLANEPSLPEGYSSIRGILEGTRKIKPFTGARLATLVDNILRETGKFQHAAFMLVYGTYHFADNLANAKTLWLSACSEQEYSEMKRDRAEEFRKSNICVREGFKGAMHWLNTEKLEWGTRPEPLSFDLPEEFATRESLKAFVGAYFKAWREHVQDVKYGARGLDYAISELELHHPPNIDVQAPAWVL
jgi:hypothetical protein